MSEQRVETRLHVEDALATGATIGLGPERAHFLKHVLRLEAGAAVALFNARDGEFLARIDGIGKGWASLAVGDRRRAPQPECDLWLLFAPIKFGRIDFLAQKATELGVTRLQPVFTRHTAVDRVNTDRLRANAIEAAEQTQRLGVPEVLAAVTLERAIGEWPRDRPLYVCAEYGPAEPVATVFGRHPAGSPAGVLTGPEGGFARAELDALVKLPFVSAVGLGPRVLRADTAALSALAVWQAVAGDWRAR
ncbi:MAG: 16S rRNA (uracil(1498)-N(3))-methyltransferase [Alphaproteobacteria bacterium]|nr:16S rRNA (uracil(1498)-N(3))-methyltransferase [Alphaproteobacteria bacterium]